MDERPHCPRCDGDLLLGSAELEPLYCCGQCGIWWMEDELTGILPVTIWDEDCLPQPERRPS